MNRAINTGQRICFFIPPQILQLVLSSCLLGLSLSLGVWDAFKGKWQGNQTSFFFWMSLDSSEAPYYKMIPCFIWFCWMSGKSFLNFGNWWFAKFYYFRSLTYSCHAASTDISIVHCSREVFQVTSCIGTELLPIGSSCSSCLCTSIWRGPSEYITYEFVLTSPAVFHMSSNLDSFRDGW